MSRAIMCLQLGATLLMLSACSPSDGCGNNCPLTTAQLDLTGGTATIGWLEGTDTTVPIVAPSGGQVSAETCVLFGESPSVSRYSGIQLSVLSDNSVNGFLYLVCNAAGQELGTFLLDGIVADPRRLDADTTQSAGFGSCNSDVSATAVITVTESVGGIAPYPDMVTDDYRRSFSVELDTGTLDCAAVTPTAGCPVCQQLSRMQVTFSMTQTAASFRHTENAPCLCE